MFLAAISLVRPVPAFTALARLQPTLSAFSRFRQKRNLSMSLKYDSPSAQRNKEPIWDILATKVLPLLPKKEDPTNVLEIAAGAGVHSIHFSLRMLESKRSFLWYPSEPDESSRGSIQAYLDDTVALKDKLQPPLNICLTANGPANEDVVKGLTFDLMVCINMIHISPWEATLGLLQMAGERLDQGGVLYLYGPYKVNGEAVESNL